MIFGKKFSVGNFTYIKTNRVLAKKEMTALRDGMPLDIKKKLGRAGLPCITVSSVSDNWCVRYTIGCVMYDFIEYQHTQGEAGRRSLQNLFTMMYSDTMVFGDQEYWEDKARALEAYMARQKKEVDKSTDDKDLEAVKAEEEARATILDMAKEAKDES